MKNLHDAAVEYELLKLSKEAGLDENETAYFLKIASVAANMSADEYFEAAGAGVLRYFKEAGLSIPQQTEVCLAFVALGSSNPEETLRDFEKLATTVSGAAEPVAPVGANPADPPTPAQVEPEAPATTASQPDPDITNNRHIRGEYASGVQNINANMGTTGRHALYGGLGAGAIAAFLQGRRRDERGNRRGFLRSLGGAIPWGLLGAAGAGGLNMYGNFNQGRNMFAQDALRATAGAWGGPSDGIEPEVYGARGALDDAIQHGDPSAVAAAQALYDIALANAGVDVAGLAAAGDPDAINSVSAGKDHVEPFIEEIRGRKPAQQEEAAAEAEAAATE